MPSPPPKKNRYNLRARKSDPVDKKDSKKEDAKKAAKKDASDSSTNRRRKRTDDTQPPVKKPVKKRRVQQSAPNGDGDANADASDTSGENSTDSWEPLDSSEASTETDEKESEPTSSEEISDSVEEGEISEVSGDQGDSGDSANSGGESSNGESSMTSGSTSNSEVDIPYASEEEPHISEEEINAFMDELLSKEHAIEKFSDLTKQFLEYFRIQMEKQCREAGHNVFKTNTVGDQYEEFIKHILKNRPTFARIMDLSMTTRDKLKLMEMNMIWLFTVEFSEAYFTYYHRIERFIRDHTIVGMSVSEYEEQMKLNEPSIPLGVQILTSKHTPKNKAIMKRKFLELADKDGVVHGNAGREKWLRQALRIPTERITYTIDALKKAQMHLEKHIKYLDDVKEQLLVQYYNRITHPKSFKITCLVGPPGIGKTYILQEMARAVGIKFTAISMAGAHDDAFLKGHSVTYVNSVPGIIAESCLDMGCLNGMIYFDEIDKLALRAGDSRADRVLSCFYEVLDPERNEAFIDNYFSPLTFDLSEMWFVLSINDMTALEQFNPALVSRLEFVHLRKYTFPEKINIVKDCIMPKLLHTYGLKQKITVTEHAIKRIHDKSNVKEEGMRQFQRNCESIIQNIEYSVAINSGILNVKPPKFHNPTIQYPLEMTDALVDQMFFEHTPQDDKNESYRTLYG